MIHSVFSYIQDDSVTRNNSVKELSAAQKKVAILASFVFFANSIKFGADDDYCVSKIMFIANWPFFCFLTAFSLLDYSRYFYRKFREQNSGRNLKNKEVILILSATKDHNGALSQPNRSLMSQLYAPVFRQVSSLSDIRAEIKRMARRRNTIKLLVLHAHGSSNCINLHSVSGHEEDLVSGRIIGTRSRQLKKTFHRLPKECTIALYSCNTGLPGKSERMPIAQAIARAAPGCVVIAPLGIPDTIKIFPINHTAGVIFKSRPLTRLFQGIFPPRSSLRQWIQGMDITCRFYSPVDVANKNLSR